MKLTLAAIGKCKSGPELTLIQKYQKQLGWKLSIVEISPSKQKQFDARIAQESEQLLGAVQACSKIIVCDSRGKTLGSEAFAKQFQDWQLNGDTQVGLIIGGADGVSDGVRSKADLLLSFGRMTWPHMLARVMLCEQLYRAYSITIGHPYHSGH